MRATWVRGAVVAAAIAAAAPAAPQWVAVGLSPAFELGFDLLLEAGSLGGYGNTTFSFTLGPEFRL